MSKKYTMHVISGGHWDREWRLTATQSKLRLAQLVDNVLDILEREPSYKCFCLDGGAVVLEDYFSVRPENQERLKRLVEQKRIDIVPWYTLPETFTVAPECLIRNLLLGKKMAAQYGGAMKAGYTATSYGQTSQLPQIYRGFGIETAIFYRGMNKFQLPSFFQWEGKDGSTLYVKRCTDESTRANWLFFVFYPVVIGKREINFDYTFNPAHEPVHMCDEGLYERPFLLAKEDYSYSTDHDTLEFAVQNIMKQAVPDAVGRHLTGMHFDDNGEPYEFTAPMLEALNAVSPDMEIIQDRWDEYMDTLIAEAKDLFVHKGELRYPAVIHGFNGLLGATHSSRVKLKLLNEQAESLLTHHAEPLASMAAMLGWRYPELLLAQAWQSLLQNHAHDSICGAAVDQAHEDMLYRFSQARCVAEEVAAGGSVELYKHIDLSCFQPGDYTITVFNTLNQPRKAILPVFIDLPRQVTAGGGGDPCTGLGGGAAQNIHYYDILDEQGRQCTFHTLSKDDVVVGVERVLDTPALQMPAKRHRILLEVDAPPMGYASYALRPRGPRYIEKPETRGDRPLLARENGVLENQFMKVTLNPNGTFDIESKVTGRHFKNLHYFTDNGEVGNAHFCIPPQRDRVVSSIGLSAHIHMLEGNELRGVIEVSLKLPIPKAAALDQGDRLSELVELPITYRLTLEKDCKYLKIRTRLNNQARDHKLKVNFPTGVATDEVSVESAFAVEQRCIQYTESGDNFEKFFPYQPMQNFVDLSDGESGFAFLNKGMREYEMKDDAERTLAVTLLRTHRAYMTANSQMTPDEFAKYTGLHSIGEHEYRYALYPHVGGWEQGEVLQAAYAHKAELRAVQGAPKPGTLPPTLSFIDVQPADALMVSAFKQSEDGTGFILRIWNTGGKLVNATLQFALPVRTVERVMLDESPGTDLPLCDGKVRFDATPHQIVTLKLSV